MTDSQPLTLVHAILLFSTAFLAGGLNSVAGGGSFITFPTLILSGISPIVANATSNTAIWVASLSSAGAYRKDLGIGRRELLLIGGSLGGYFCANYARQLEPQLIRRVVLIVAVSMTIYFFVHG